MTTISVDELPGLAGKARRKRREMELQMQIAVIQWADLQVVTGRYPELSRLYAVPNGGARTKAEAGKLKASGVRAGVPDLVLPVSRGGYHGAYMELKWGENDETTEQSDWLDWLHAHGHFTATCWTFESATQTLSEYLDSKHIRN